MAPTKEELENENAALREQVAQLEDQAAAAAAPATAPAPRYPTDDAGNRQLSAGELNDLEETGVTVSPFDGVTLNALDEGVEPRTPEARTRAEQAQERARGRESSPNEWPAAGPPPAEGGNADPDGTNVSTGR